MTQEKSQTSAELDERILATAQDGRKKLKVIGENGYYKAKWTNGGRLPDGLVGKFTSRHEAQEAINVWLAGRK